MQNPEPVRTDLILDRYLANIFPASLLPTAVYLVILAIIAFYVSGWIWNYLRPDDLGKEHTD